MFDLSLAEMAFIAVVALIVIGPKELPVLMRTVGRWVGKAKRMSNEVLQQLELDDLQKEIHTIRNDAGEIFEAYDLSDVEDASRTQPKPKVKPKAEKAE